MTTTHHFRVGNGDMTLIETDSGRFILIDINIRAAADDPDDDTPDVGRQLKDRLPRDNQGRPYVDAFLLTHPDKDHCTGLQAHFHLVQSRSGRLRKTRSSSARCGHRPSSSAAHRRSMCSAPTRMPGRPKPDDA